jgi:hypothetical protein
VLSFVSYDVPSLFVEVATVYTFLQCVGVVLFSIEDGYRATHLSFAVELGAFVIRRTLQCW